MEPLKEKYREDLMRRIEATPDEEFEECGYAKETITQECHFPDLLDCYQKDIEEFHCNPDWAYVDAMESAFGILLKTDAKPTGMHHRFPVAGILHSRKHWVEVFKVEGFRDSVFGYRFNYFNVIGNVSSATFVIQSELCAEWERNGVFPPFTKFVKEILDGKEKETPDGIYEFTYGEDTTEMLLRYL